MPSVILTTAELAVIAGKAKHSAVESARIDWEPNIGHVELRLYDAAGACIERLTITGAGRR